ncbi:MAG: hypothetical protein ACE5EK_07030 [Nitrospinales bacterium]
MSPFSRPQVLRITLFSLLIVFISETSLTAQEEPDDLQSFINLGLISFSPKYKLAENGNHIIFRIRNNSGRSISNIFGWVYSFTKGKDGKGTDFRLVNNPHKGGMIVKGGPHIPGKIIEWRFLLTEKILPEETKREFTLRVSQKSIFFMRLEPPVQKPK